MKKNLILSVLFKRIAAFLAIGTNNYKFYRNYNIPEERIFLTPYSVDNDFFIQKAKEYLPYKAEIKKQIGINADTHVIIYAGKFLPRKGLYLLLEAFMTLKRKDVALLMVGDGQEKDGLAGYVYQNKIANVVFTGFINQSLLPKYYIAGDIFVLPSLFESWGLVINEAMCCGLPVIVSDNVGCIADLIDGNGIVFKSQDADALVNSLKELLDSSDKRLYMGRRSLEIISQWNYDRVVQGILRALDYINKK